MAPRRTTRRCRPPRDEAHYPAIPDAKVGHRPSATVAGHRPVSRSHDPSLPVLSQLAASLGSDQVAVISADADMSAQFVRQPMLSVAKSNLEYFAKLFR